jgi:hypothetical protein
MCWQIQVEPCRLDRCQCRVGFRRIRNLCPQNFTYGSQGWNPVNLTGLIAAAQQVFHFKRRNYVQGM